MSVLTLAEISSAAIAAEREKLVAAHQRVQDLAAHVAQLQAELQQAREDEANLSTRLRWRELMADVNADDTVYSVTERLMDTFAAFRESLVEPEGYAQSEQEEVKSGEDIVPYSDTDDYADFSAVESVVEDVLAVAKEALETHSAVSLARGSGRGSLTSSYTSRGRPSCASAESPETQATNAAVRRRALLQLLVVTVLMGKVEEHCSFSAIPDPSNTPRTDAEELRDGVTSVWQWLFYEQPAVLTAAERKEWMDIASTFLGEAYTAAP